MGTSTTLNPLKEGPQVIDQTKVTPEMPEKLPQGIGICQPMTSCGKTAPTHPRAVAGGMRSALPVSRGMQSSGDLVSYTVTTGGKHELRI